MLVWEKESNFKWVMILLVALLKGNKPWMKWKQTSKGDILLKKTKPKQQPQQSLNKIVFPICE